MKTYFQHLGLLALLVGATSTFAGEIDGSSSLLCAATQTVSCDSVGDCVKGPAEAFNLPVFIKFDTAKKQVITAKEGSDPRTSNILEVASQEKELVFIGIDPVGSWTAAIDKASGDMTVSVALNGEGYLVFGSCIKR